MGAVRVRRKLVTEYRVGGNSMSEERKQDRLQSPVDAFVNSREAKSRVYTNPRFAVGNNENELSRYAIYPNMCALEHNGSVFASDTVPLLRQRALRRELSAKRAVGFAAATVAFDLFIGYNRIYESLCDKRSSSRFHL